MSPLSTFLDGQNFTQLRGAAWLSLSDTGYLLRGSVTDDSGGGGTLIWGTAGTVPCRIDPITRANRGEVGGRIDERALHLVRMPPGTVVTAEDRISISGRGTYEVMAVRERTREWVQVVEVIPL